MAVASVLGALAVGRLLGGPLRRSALAFAAAAGAAGCAVALASPLTVVPSAILVGLGLSAAPAAATAFARARSTPAGAPVALAAITVAFGLGQLIGPLATGIAADHLGLNSVALVASCAYLLCTAFAVADAFAVPEGAAWSMARAELDIRRRRYQPPHVYRAWGASPPRLLVVKICPFPGDILISGVRRQVEMTNDAGLAALVAGRRMSVRRRPANADFESDAERASHPLRCCAKKHPRIGHCTTRSVVDLARRGVIIAPAATAPLR